ncbi:hypothetical protein ACWECC_30110 [Streptomyces microflavus]
MNDKTMPADRGDLPAVDEELAGALLAQGELGDRALGLLRDAHRVLSGAGGLERPGEIAEACVRSAADALLKLPGVSDTRKLVGLQSAAKGLLDAIDALPDPAAGQAAEDPQQVAGWGRVRDAAEVLRGEVRRPGGYHRRRARGIAERLTGLTLGAAQDQALSTWGELYAKASGTLHGAGADPGRPARLYTDLLVAARDLLVPLPARAARVLELTAHQRPGRSEAVEIARWSDPRATAFFFRSTPAAVWLGVLAEHAPHLLDADPGADGRWPAAPFLTHVAAIDPAAARAWISDHAERVAAAGRPAVNAVLALACRPGAVVPAAQVRAVFQQAVPDGWALHGPGDGWTARWTAAWAREAPLSERDGDWIAVVEQLLAAAVDAEHANRRLRQDANGHGPADAAPASEAGVFDFLDDTDNRREGLVGRPVGDLSVEAPRLLRALVATAHGAGPHSRIRVIRAVAAGLLRRDLQAAAPAARHIVFHDALDQVRTEDPSAFGGPRLARTVLDLAAADADAGVPLAERTAQWKKIADADPRIHARLLAAHLTTHRPTAPARDEERWTRALDLVPRVLADRPAPETARLAEALWNAAGPEERDELDRAARTALGAAPTGQHMNQVLPASTSAMKGAREPLTSWLRAWAWSPVLPAHLLADWEPLLTAVRRLMPAGPPDPRTVPSAVPVRTGTAPPWEDLAALAAERSPAEAAAALATTAASGTEPGADAYAMVLHRIVDADPARWTADVPEVLDALPLPVLRAGYLAATAAAAARPGAFPGDTLPQACAAALALRRTLAPQSPLATDRDRTTELLTDQAVFDLLTHAWRIDADLAGVLPDALAHLRTLAAELTRLDAEGEEETARGSSAGAPLGPDPAARALGCLLHYAAHHARTNGQMPRDILDLTASAVTSCIDHKAVALMVGVHLSDLHRHAPDFTAAHRAELLALPTDGRPSPARAWLEWGRADPQLLTAFGRAELLAAVRARVRGASQHLAHALATDGNFLGDPATAWASIADGPGGASAASRLLEDLVLRRPATEPLGAATGTPPITAATELWRAALAADLPAGALAGSGLFARTDLADDVWLPLARASAEHTPALVDASAVAERAAAHPDAPDALHLTAQLVSHPQHPWEDEYVLAHAHALLDAAVPGTAGEHRAAVEELRRALVEAGELDAART